MRLLKPYWIMVVGTLVSLLVATGAMLIVPRL